MFRKFAKTCLAAVLPNLANQKLPCKRQQCGSIVVKHEVPRVSMPRHYPRLFGSHLYELHSISRGCTHTHTVKVASLHCDAPIKIRKRNRKREYDNQVEPISASLVGLGDSDERGVICRIWESCRTDDVSSSNRDGMPTRREMSPIESGHLELDR